jgi:hypothetical protein
MVSLHFLQAHDDKEKRWSYSELDQREGLVLEWSMQLFRDAQDGFGEVEFEMCDHACVDLCLWI